MPTVERSSRARLGCLAALLALVGLALASTVGSGHPYHLMGGNGDTTVGAGVGADTTQQLAQSFSVAAAFKLTRVALDVSDVGASDSLTVEIQTDSAGLPSGTVLATSTNDTGAAFEWANFDLSVALDLSPGVPYWIVATSSGLLGAGYSWWNSGYDANSTGSAAQTVPILGWSVRSPPDDFAFLLYGWAQTTATLAHRSASASATAVAGGETSFVLDVRVSGSDSAENLTIDYRYPASNLTYERDTSAATGLAFGLTQFPGHLRYVVAQAPPGFYSFAITFLADKNVPAGTIDTANASMTYRDFLGVDWSVAAQNASVRILNLAFRTLTSGLIAASTDPGSPLQYWLAYATDPLNSSTVPDFQVSLKLGQGLVFQSSTPPAPESQYDASSREVTWSLGDLLAGSSGNVSANVTIAIGLPPLYALRADLNATYAESPPPTPRVTLLTGFPTAIVTAPQIGIELTTNRTTIRSNETVSFSIVLTNTGNGVAGHAWVNDTFDPRVRFAGARGVGQFSSPTAGEVRWNTTRLPPGVTTIVLDLQALSIIDDQAVVRNSARLAYTDANGNLREQLTTPLVNLTVRSPRLLVSLALDKTAVPSGNEVTETVVVLNLGTERAFDVLVNQTFGVFTNYARDTNTLPPLISSGPFSATYSWRIPEVNPGAQVAFSVTLQSVNNGESDVPVDLHLDGTYTDAFGQGRAAFSSAGQSLSIQASSAVVSLFRNPIFLAVLVVGSIVGGVGAIERAFGRFRIEDLFFVRRDGILIVHRSRTASTDKEPDIFAAMFTVIQEFVRDSFGYIPGRQLRQLSFGNLHGFIAPGEFTYLAVMYSGRIGPVARRALVRTVQGIERKRGAFLQKWDGNVRKVADLSVALAPLVRDHVGALIGLFPPKLLDETEIAPA